MFFFKFYRFLSNYGTKNLLEYEFWVQDVLKYKDWRVDWECFFFFFSAENASFEIRPPGPPPKRPPGPPPRRPPGPPPERQPGPPHERCERHFTNQHRRLMNHLEA